MRLVLLLTVAFLFNLSASTYSQNKTFSLDVNGETVREVIKEIESQSEFRFFYNEDFRDIERKINLSVRDKRIEFILEKIFDNSEITYHVLDNNLVVLAPKRMLQEIVVKGKVTDSGGSPLPGVNIIEQGTTLGAVTDLDGNYTITVSSADAVLLFSFVGYLSEEISVSGQSNIDIILVEDIMALDEVVVIGYGTRQKKDLTGAVSQISSEDITKTTNMTPQLAMQGRMPGVFVSNPGSNPYERPKIRIRGVSTLGFNDPLYVIDGIPLTEGGATEPDARTADQRGPVNILNMINPNDIESISVLKDASATAIYGVRASNGVILITTKRGKKGKAKVDISARYGIQNIYKEYDVMNMQQYVDAHLEAWANNPAVTPNDEYYRYYDSSSPFYLGDSENYTNDWVEAHRVQNAAIQDYNLSVSGGTEMSNYAVGAGYANQENALYSSSFDRFSAYVNSDHSLNKYLKVGESFRTIYSKTESDQGYDLREAATVAPWQPLYDPDGLMGYALPGRDVDGTFASYGYGNSTRFNRLALGELSTIQRNLFRSMGTFYAELTPVKGLRFKGTVSFDYYTNTQERYLDQRRGLFEPNRGTLYDVEGNTYRRRLNDNINIVKEFLIGYKNSFGSHSIDLVLNAMDQQVKWNVAQNAIDVDSPITSWDQRRISGTWLAENKAVHYERVPSGLQGYMGRMSYNYAGRYYLDATVRRDGTSKFGTGYKWGTFPSAAAAWRISSEGFMQGLNWLDDLKMRAGWGQTGNQETRDFAYVSLVNFNPRYGFGVGEDPGAGATALAAVLGDFPILDMSWETVTTSNIGFDAILLNSRLSLTAEYYQRLTDGILQEIIIPDVIGALNAPVVNLAKVNNQGVEILAGYNNQIGELGYSVSFNLTTVKNEVIELYRGRPDGGTTGNQDDRIEEGRPINFIYGYKTDGIFQTQEEVDEWLDTYADPGYESQKSPGDVKFVDFQGEPTEEDGEDAYRSLTPDGQVDAYDQTYLGKTIPGYYYGLNLTLDYKNFDFVIDFRGVGDIQKVYTQGKQSISAGGANFVTDYLDRWTPTNPSNTIPRAIEGDPSGNNRISDRHVEDAGFFRFSNFQLGYSFQSGVLEKVGFSNMRAYFSGTNLFVVSPYSGLDPEDDSTPVTFMVGVNFGF